MSLSKFIEEKLKKAIADGEFDNLKGAGKPLNLDVYFNTPEDIRAGYTLLKNNEFVPEEVGLLKEIGDLKEKIKICADETERQKSMKTLNEKSMTLAIILERNKRER